MSASFKTCCVQKGLRANVSVERVGRRHGRRQNNNNFNNSNKKKSNTKRIINDGFRRQRVRVKVTSAAGTTGNGDDDEETIKVILKVPDMMCEGCAESVTNALESSDSFRLLLLCERRDFDRFGDKVRHGERKRVRVGG